MEVATADVIVVGLGAVGSAVSHHLAAGGARVVGIDRFAPPHDQGSSHGLTRITRLAVGEGAAFVPLVMRSHALWPELEAASGETLHRRTGGLVIGSAEAAEPITRHSMSASRPTPWKKQQILPSYAPPWACSTSIGPGRSF